MKFRILALIPLFAIMTLSFLSCDKSGDPAQLQVFVKSGSDYFGNITVNLYKTSADRDAGNVLVFAYTPGTAYDTKGAIFSDLSEGTYYVGVEFTYNTNHYVGTGQIFVPGGSETNYEIVCTKTAAGNLQVFVRKDLPSGVYMGGAMVYLYKTKDDRTNNIAMDSTTTSLTDPTLQGAIFMNLPFQRYYLRAHFWITGKYYEGDGDLLVPINTTTSYHITCTEK